MGKSCSPRRRPETSRSKMSSRPAWTAAARNAARTMSLPSKLIGRAGVPNPHAGDTFRQSGSPPPSLAFEQGRGGHFTARPILCAASLSQVLSLLFRAAHVVWRLDRLIPFAAIFAVPFTAHCLRLAISLYHTDPDSNRSDREVSPITHRIIHNDSYLEITM